MAHELISMFLTYGESLLLRCDFRVSRTHEWCSLGRKTPRPQAFFTTLRVSKPKHQKCFVLHTFIYLYWNASGSIHITISDAKMCISLMSNIQQNILGVMQLWARSASVTLLRNLYVFRSILHCFIQCSLFQTRKSYAKTNAHKKHDSNSSSYGDYKSKDKDLQQRSHTNPDRNDRNRDG
jgi:hypothetical protein